MRYTKRLAAIIAGSAIAASSVIGLAPAASASTGTNSLASVLGNDLKPGNGFDSNWYDFDIVREAADAVIAAKGVTGTKVALLADGTVPLTAFIPNDRAFQVLVKDLTGKWLPEKDVFATLAGLPNAVNTLETVLLYHVVPGATITSSDVLGLYHKPAAKRTLTTAQGGTIEAKVYVPLPKYPIVELRDADRNDANPFLVGSKLDLNKGNKQIAHGISSVLRPIDLP